MMKSLFNPFDLSWNGRTYTVPPDQVLRLIAKMEDVLTLSDLARAQTRGNLPLAKLAIAFGMALRHAGAQVTDEEVYTGMFTAGASELQRRAVTAVLALQELMVPPAALRAEPGKAGGDAAATTAASSPAATGSSSGASA